MRSLFPLVVLVGVTGACSASGDPHPPVIPSRADSVALERTACFGTCPRYRVTIASSGALRFHPKDRSRLKVDQTDSIPRESFDALTTLAVRSGFYSLPAKVNGAGPLCRRRQTDAPREIVTVYWGTGKQRVDYYTGCFPEPGDSASVRALHGLSALASAIDSVARVERWRELVRGR